MGLAEMVFYAVVVALFVGAGLLLWQVWTRKQSGQVVFKGTRQSREKRTVDMDRKELEELRDALQAVCDRIEETVSDLDSELVDLNTQIDDLNNALDEMPEEDEEEEGQVTFGS